MKKTIASLVLVNRKKPPRYFTADRSKRCSGVVCSYVVFVLLATFLCFVPVVFTGSGLEL